jgi:hypothetical protein
MRALEMAKRVHAQWLTTPRPSLNGRTPREFLHEYRPWKDRELDNRRAQWSRLRAAPPAVSRDSAQFRFGPMGTEEVVLYFDLCREAIMAAWRWIDDEPHRSIERLTNDVQLFIEGWLTSADPSEGSGEVVQSIIDLERTLMPRLASNSPLDCDCPLCRLQANEELFGPTFSICDGHHLELEDDFVFSLEYDRDEWEASRQESHDILSYEHAERLARRPLESADSLLQELGVDSERIWTSSHVDPRPAPPQLSLFAIGARLAEFIEHLKSEKAPRNLVDDLNKTFDDMSQVVRNYIDDNSSRQSTEPAEAMQEVVDRMIAQLEASALTVPETTAQSADLQSLVHAWQRQLQP